MEPESGESEKVSASTEELKSMEPSSSMNIPTTSDNEDDENEQESSLKKWYIYTMIYIEQQVLDPC